MAFRQNLASLRIENDEGLSEIRNNQEDIENRIEKGVVFSGLCHLSEGLFAGPSVEFFLVFDETVSKIFVDRGEWIQPGFPNRFECQKSGTFLFRVNVPFVLDDLSELTAQDIEDDTLINFYAFSNNGTGFPIENTMTLTAIIRAEKDDAFFPQFRISENGIVTIPDKNAVFEFIRLK